MHIFLVLIAVVVVFAVVYHFASKEVTTIETDVKTDVAKVETDIAAGVKKL